MDNVQKNLLKEIAGLEAVPEGAYNIRANGVSSGRRTTANIDIVPKEDKPGIDIIIKPGTKNERVDLPVLLTQSGLNDMVYNDFYVGDDCDILIVAGCGIHNAGNEKSEHDGIHSFHIGKNAKVKYVEKHYGEGPGKGAKVLNPTTIIEIDENGYMEMDTAQIKGVDSTDRSTTATLASKATLVVHEKLLTHKDQTAVTRFQAYLNGEDCSCHIVSRSIAKDDSHQEYISCMDGNNRCNGRTECDAIIMDNGTVTAEPRLNANNIDASLVHEAAIGKIAGEQLIKLMTLGLTEKEAEEQIVNGFLK